MKKILPLLLITLTYNAIGQNITLNVLKKADESFSQFSYSKAVEYYKLALPKGENQQYITNQIALSFRNLNEPDSSEVWFKKALELGETNPDFSFYLAEALLSNQKVSEAKYWYNNYNEKVDNDERGSRKLGALDQFDQFFDNPDQISYEEIKANSKGLDFSPAYYKNGILFVSSRPKSKWITREFNWDASSFLDLYFVNDTSSNAEYFEGGLNTKYHEGPLMFYNNQKSVVYTRNNFDGSKLKKDTEGVTNLKLYFADWDEKTKKWIDEKPFSHNNDNYSIGSPAITEDGTVLIYSSDMPGGMGASDLYISYRDGSGWSKPQNLGAKVNSKGRDGFPFIYNDLLYFSSEGREGIGGLDIYQIPFDGKKVTGEADNLGSPFNSSLDDFGLIRKEFNGFFSSNRSKSSSDDIYKFTIKEPAMILLVGEVLNAGDSSGMAKSDVFFHSENKVGYYTRTDSSGYYEVLVKAKGNMAITAGKYDFFPLNGVDISLKGSGDTLKLDKIYLQREGEIINIGDTVQIPDLVTIVDNRIPDYEDTRSFVDEFGDGDTLKLQNVYFDLDKHFVRNSEKPVLTKAANFMIEHVDVKIILSSFTDSRSTNSYNDQLSKKRSKSVAAYLVEMGVDPKKIETFSYGENKLVNNCEDDIDCTEDQHQLNRRTEISFVKDQVEEE